MNADLRIVRELVVEPAHRLLIALQASSVGRRVVVAVKLGEGGDEAGLALAPGADPPRLREQGAPLPEVCGGGDGEGIHQESHGLAPVGHDAGWIALAHPPESFAGGLVPERVLQLHRLVEGGLRLRRATDGEMNFAEGCCAWGGALRVAVILLSLPPCRAKHEAQDKSPQLGLCWHRFLPAGGPDGCPASSAKTQPNSPYAQPSSASTTLHK